MTKADRIAATASSEIRIAINSLEVVLAQFNDPDAPWTPLMITLFKDRVGTAKANLDHLARRIDQVSAGTTDPKTEISA